MCKDETKSLCNANIHKILHYAKIKQKNKITSLNLFNLSSAKESL